MAVGKCKGVQRDLSPVGSSQASKPLMKMKHSPWSYWKLRSDLREKADLGRDSIIELTQNQKESMPSDESQAKAYLIKKYIFF